MTRSSGSQPGDLAVDRGQHALALLARNVIVPGEPGAGALQGLGTLRCAALAVAPAAEDDAGAIIAVAFIDFGTVATAALFQHHGIMAGAGAAVQIEALDGRSRPMARGMVAIALTGEDHDPPFLAPLAVRAAPFGPAAAPVADAPDIDEAGVRHGLEGNLCRCTGYQNIVAAVLDGARAMQTSGKTGA